MGQAEEPLFCVSPRVLGPRSDTPVFYKSRVWTMEKRGDEMEKSVRDHLGNETYFWERLVFFFSFFYCLRTLDPHCLAW